MSNFRQLIINPGSTSTKIAVFEDETAVFETTLRHKPEELAPFKKVADQYHFRKDLVMAALRDSGIAPDSLAAVVGRGGLLKPIPGGTFAVNQPMLDDLRNLVRGNEHASNLGAMIAYEIGQQYHIPAFIVDAVAVDEFEPIARITGFAEVERESLFHALNQKATARRAAHDLGQKYEELNLIVAHMGGGISVGGHRRGRVVDVNGLGILGCFAPERAGSIPGDKVVRMCFSGQYDQATMIKKFNGKGGLVSHLGTSDSREVEKMIAAGDQRAELVYHAMAYNVAKDIAAMAAVFHGEVDAIVFTGGVAYSQLFTGWVREMAEFIAPVLLYPGENELLSLALGGLRVLRGEEPAQEYR